jgi:hypothetical protein
VRQAALGSIVLFGTGCSIFFEPECADDGPGVFDDVNVENEDDPTVSPDRLELYFDRSRGRARAGELMVSTRATRCDPWRAAEKLPATIGMDIGNPRLSHDGQRLYFILRLSAQEREAWRLVRGADPLDWGEPEEVALPVENPRDLFEVQTPEGPVFYTRTSSGIARSPPPHVSYGEITFPGLSNPGQVWVSQDETVLYFDATEDGVSGIYRVDGTGGGTFPGTPVRLEGLPGYHHEDPWVTRDGWLYYAAETDPEAEPGTGLRDLFAAPLGDL